MLIEEKRVPEKKRLYWVVGIFFRDREAKFVLRIYEKARAK